MKKLVLFFVLVVGIAYPQSTKGDITLAPQIGLNFSSETISDSNSESRTAFAAGVIGEYYFNDRWSFRTGLLYDPMGGKGGGFTDKINYLTLPLNANWHFGKTRSWYLNFGVGVSILLNAETEDSDNISYDLKNYLNSTDVGLMLGIGYKFNISDNLQFYADLQGFGGLIDIVSDDYDEITNDRITNSRNSLNIGLIFKI